MTRPRFSTLFAAGVVPTETASVPADSDSVPAESNPMLTKIVDNL